MPARKLNTSMKSKAGKAKIPHQGKCSGWKAELRIRSRGGLVVYNVRGTGKCRFPIQGYKVTLKVAVPQGINRSILLLQRS